jgi:hypothetical protein
VPAAVALLDMTAKRSCATQFDCGHSATLRAGESSAVLLSICVAVAAEHIRHFGGIAGHRARVQAGAGVGRSGAEVDEGRASKGLAVAHTLLVARRR